MNKIHKVLFILLLYSTGLSGTGWAADQITDLTELSIEELMNIKVTSVAKKAQNLSEAPAAVYVITREDIRRSGASSIPDLLRMVPGFEVGQIRSNAWAVSARGFNDLYANKLLVLMDGRSVYTHLFSGVEWHLLDMLLEDVERIEVIRGPGGTLWGANAVNGIVNIITQNAVDTPGGLATVGAGNEEKRFAGLRYGWKIGIDTDCRAYLKYNEKDASTDKNHEGNDDWQIVRGGFRMDGTFSLDDDYTFQGDFYNGKTKDPISIFNIYQAYQKSIQNMEEDFSGWNLLARWTHTFSPSSDMACQLYYNYSSRKKESVEELHPSFRKQDGNTLTQLFMTPFQQSCIETVDADFQHRYNWGRHEIVWGAGLRYMRDNLSYDAQSPNQIDIENREIWLFSALVQDEIRLMADRLLLTLGTKFEYHDYTGWEIQPGAKLLWKISDRQVGWASISRAVRTPSRWEHDVEAMLLYVNPPNKSTPDIPPFMVFATGNTELKSEILLAYEMGYRIQPREQLSLDIAAYYNEYDDLITYDNYGGAIVTDTAGNSVALIVNKLGNHATGKIYGVELTATWDPFKWQRFRFSYSRLNSRFSYQDADNPENYENETPRNQFTIRSATDLPYNIELDMMLRYVDPIPGYDIDRYTELDMRLGWKPFHHLEFSLVGKNLLHDHHPEFRDSLLVNLRSEIERSLYGKITWHF